MATSNLLRTHIIQNLRISFNHSLNSTIFLPRWKSSFYIKVNFLEEFYHFLLLKKMICWNRDIPISGFAYNTMCYWRYWRVFFDLFNTHFPHIGVFDLMFFVYVYSAGTRCGNFSLHKGRPNITSSCNRCGVIFAAKFQPS